MADAPTLRDLMRKVDSIREELCVAERTYERPERIRDIVDALQNAIDDLDAVISQLEGVKVTATAGD
jgi:hypothetical protein